MIIIYGKIVEINIECIRRLSIPYCQNTCICRNHCGHVSHVAAFFHAVMAIPYLFSDTFPKYTAGILCQGRINI